MRKRKSPIVLVTVLGVVFATVVGLQFASSRVVNPNEAPPPPPPAGDDKPIGTPREKTAKSSIANDVKASMGSAEPATSQRSMGPGGPGAGGPIILNASAVPSGKPEKPKPNPSSTAAQWYNNESAMSKDKG